MTKPTIWCLFSVAEEYDQPQNNLVRWWSERPSIEALAKFLGHPLDKASDETITKIVDVWKGVSATLHAGGPDYRLEEVREGEGP